jgi:hypothetical protein
MIFEASVEATDDGEFVACSSDPLVSARGPSMSSALERLRAEIRYRVEFCPCSSVEDDYVQLRVGGLGSG